MTALHRRSVLGGRHELVIGRLTRDDASFTVHYTLTPPLPDGESGAHVLLALEAEDDLGNEYLDWGGAYGVPDGAAYTDGSVTGQPAPPAEARRLTLRLTLLSGAVEDSYEIELPLGP